MNTIRIALLQHPAHQDPSVNDRRCIQAIREAAKNGASIVCTQELFRTEYFCRTQDTANFDLAESIPGPSTRIYGTLAAELNIVIVLSLFERRTAGVYHNTTVVLDTDGSTAGTYRKMHIPQDPGFEEKFYFTPGDTGFHAFPTRHGTVGVIICWDQWFPESARLTALAGADIIFCPTAIGWLSEEKEEFGQQQLHSWQRVQQGHAVANGCYYAAVNRVGVEGTIEFWGNSFVSNYAGDMIACGSESTGEIVYADCDLQAMEDHRRIWPFFRDRRIDAYRGITERFLD